MILPDFQLVPGIHVHVAGIEHAYLQQGRVLAFDSPVSPAGGAMRKKVDLGAPRRALSRALLIPLHLF